MTDLLVDIHGVAGWVAIAANGVVGLWGVFMAWRRLDAGHTFRVASGVAIVVMLAQVFLGVYLVGVGGLEPGSQHLFYGVVVAFCFAFAYIYRAQFRSRPGLAFGLLHLFVMGLGLRGVQTLNIDF